MTYGAGTNDSQFFNYKMKKIIKFILFVVVVCGAGFYFKQPIQTLFSRVQNKVLPCQQPIVYSYGFFDQRFGITKKEFSDAVDKAVQIWEKPIEKKLFEYSDDSAQIGILKINLVFDSRQETTIKLKKLGIQLDDNKSTYDKVKAEYEQLSTSYESKKVELDAVISLFNADKSNYDNEVNYWNKRGGAPRDVYNRLDQAKILLQERADKINQSQNEINDLIGNINALADELNRLAQILNLNVSKYNTVGQQNGAEFQEGLYKGDIRGEEIDIYEFFDNKQLVRVLTHELGHALGLDHLSNPEAIMYELNQGKSENLTVDDIVALKSRCGVGE